MVDFVEFAPKSPRIVSAHHVDMQLVKFCALHSLLPIFLHAALDLISSFFGFFLGFAASSLCPCESVAFSDGVPFVPLSLIHI